MSEASKKLAADTDRVSELPIEILRSILHNMRISDGARISMVSKHWRFVWRTMPKLIFDKLWLEEIIQRKRKPERQYFQIINKILLHHIGHITDFSLYIPRVNSTSKIDEWLLFLSRSGIQILALSNSNPIQYKLPYYAFSCSTLRCLGAVNCILEPPPQFHEGFENLTKLILEEVTFLPTFATSTLKMPKLKIFELSWCSGIQYLNVYAPNLEELSIIVDGDNYNFDLNRFITGADLKTLIYVRSEEISNQSPTIMVNLSMILNKWPCLKILTVDGALLKSPDAGFSPRNLANKFGNLVGLGMNLLNFADVDEIYFAITLICCCINLKEVAIKILPNTNSDDEMVINYLSSGAFEGLKQLQHCEFIVIFYSEGSRAEMLFIKIILTNLPSLQKMIIKQSNTIRSPDEDFVMAEELLHFTRASPTAEDQR